MKNEESILSIVCNRVLILSKADCFAFHIPNEGKRSLTVGGMLKRMGLKAGVFDWCIMCPGGRVGWIELKLPGETLTKAQKDFREIAKSLGFETFVAHDVHEFIAALKSLGVKFGVNVDLWDSTITRGI